MNSRIDQLYSGLTTKNARAQVGYGGAYTRSGRLYETGLEASFAHRYDSGVDIVDLRVGLSNPVDISGGFSVLTKVDYLVRESNIRTIDLDSISPRVGGNCNF